MKRKILINISQLVTPEGTSKKRGREMGAVKKINDAAISYKKKVAEEARKRLDKLDTSDSSSPLSEVRKSISQKYGADKLKKKAETTTVVIADDDKKKSFITSSMSKLSRSERKLVGKISEQGYTLVPVEVYLKGSLVKVQIALAKGKKLYDKRHDIAKKDMKREAERDFKIRNLD